MWTVAAGRSRTYDEGKGPTKDVDGRCGRRFHWQGVEVRFYEDAAFLVRVGLLTLVRKAPVFKLQVLERGLDLGVRPGGKMLEVQRGMQMLGYWGPLYTQLYKSFRVISASHARSFRSRSRHGKT